MNPWEEDWSGTSQKAPWEEDWSTQAPAPSPASTLRRVDILPPAENKVPKWAQSLPEFAQPLFADGEQKALESWRERVAYELRPGASGMEPTKAITQEDIDRIAINRWEQAGRQAPKKDIGQAVAGLAGFADIATFGLSDEFAALAPFERTLMETGSLEKAGQAFGEARQDYKALQSDATQQRPFSTRTGQTAALLAPGAKGYSIGMQAAPKLVPASVAAAVAGKSVPARLARYSGRLAAMTGIGALDYGLYNFAAEAPNQARVAGTEMPGVGDRLQFAAEEAISPTGLVAAAVPAIGSLGYRAGRGVVTAGKNTLEDTIAATRAAPRPEAMAQGVPLPQLRFRGGSFTPADVRGRVDLNTPDPATGRTPRQIAIDRLLDEGFSPDEAERAVRLLSYDGRANVNEMLFEIDNNLQEIGLAVGRINRPGRKILEEEFKARNEGMFDEIRQAIRRAVGASGDDLEDFNETMAKKAKEQSADGYAAAYGKQISDDTWQKITGLLGDTPDGLDAARKGAELARNSARRDPAKLEAARQLDELADILGSGGAPQTKLSTVALDFLDRGLRRKVDVAVRQGDNAYAASLLDFRNALRGSGLDAETGLNIPRTIYAQYQAAAKAAEFGERAAGKAVSLRQLKQQFLQAQRAADQALEEGIGEGSGIIDEALMMGWVRGTEDLIEREENPGTLIRKLYGSERQRQKMLDMLRELPETASPGLKSSVTKDRKALVGSRDGNADYEFGFNLSTGQRVEGRVPVRSLFDRQRDMLESQRVTVAASPTGQVGDAIANQVGDRQRAQKLLAFVQGIYQNPANFAARVIDQIGQPLLYQKDVNRELGELLSTRGREKLLSVIDEIRQRQLARSGGTPPAPGAPRRPPLSGPPAGGGTAAGGFAPALRTDLGNAAGGAVGGGILPMPSTSDPQEDMRNRMGAILGGAALGFGARRFAGGGAAARGQGMGAPKTPQQAMRAELPGSPEYEAAVAKGLDMSTPARKARAQAAGYNTDEVLYHGTASDVKAFDPQMAGSATKARSARMGTWLTSSPRTAEGYAEAASGTQVQKLIDQSYAAESAGQWDKAAKLMAEAEALEAAGFGGETIMPLYVRGRIKEVDMQGARYDPDDMQLSNIVYEAQAAGFDGVKLRNFSDEAGYGVYRPTDHIVVFDPANIRSVHAAFDPDKAASPILTAGLGGGGRKPPRQPSTRGEVARDVGRDVGVTAGAFALAPQASAQTSDGSEELRIAKSRVTKIETQDIPQIQNDLRTLEDPNADPRAIQELLLRRGYDLGPRGADGQIGPRTREAIAKNRADIRGELDVARSELEKARARVKDLEVREAQAANQGGSGALGKIAPIAGAAAGLALAYGTRRGGVAKSRLIAQQAAQKANTLLNAKPVSRAATGADSLNTRAANVNEFWRLGGAGDSVPFKTDQKGQWRPRAKAMEPSQLFPAGPTRFQAQDAGIIGGSLVEAGGSHMWANSLKADISEAKAEAERYAAAGDIAGMERALKRQRQAEGALAVAVFLERAGLFMAAGRTGAAMKMPYATVRPYVDMPAAERERALLLSTIEKNRK